MLYRRVDRSTLVCSFCSPLGRHAASLRRYLRSAGLRRTIDIAHLIWFAADAQFVCGGRQMSIEWRPRIIRRCCVLLGGNQLPASNSQLYARILELIVGGREA